MEKIKDVKGAITSPTTTRCLLLPAPRTRGRGRPGPAPGPAAKVRGSPIRKMFLLQKFLNTLTYDPTRSVSPRLATGPVSARTVLMRGAVQQRCEWREEIYDAGRCPSRSANGYVGALCLYHVREEISDEDPNRELLEKAKEKTIRIQEHDAACRKDSNQKNDGARLRREIRQKEWRADTGYNQTDENRQLHRDRRDREAKAARERLRAAYEEFAADMKQRHPSDWKTRIVAINTDAQTDCIVDRIEATRVNELRSLCTQPHELLLSTNDAPVEAVLNGEKTMSYIGLSANSSPAYTCRAPPGLGIMRGQASRLRWNCSGAVRQSDYVDGRCSSTQ